ncbi:MAG: phosphotransferase [Chloroflexota bacterium]|nr:phosphotransferase [Chloroflexota bacterium]
MPEPTNLGAAEFHQIAERALPHWGLEPDRIELIAIAENCVFRVETPDSPGYVLRIHRPGYHSLQELESELEWARALADVGISVSVGRPTLDGCAYVEVPTPDGDSSRIVGLIDWTEGHILDDEIEREPDPDRIADRFEQIGRIAARIHNQASAWSPPPGFVRHEFDVPGFVGDSPFWGRFWDVPILRPQQRAVLLRARDGIESLLGDYGKGPDIYSMIHADLHPKNFVVTGSGGLHVIDFDDAGFGWHQYELAVALCTLEEEPYFESVLQALVSGYRSLRPLSEEALALLPLFLVIRSLVSIGWRWERPDLGRRGTVPRLIDDACKKVVAFGF